MSFLNELKKRKDNLKETVTVVTNADGQRYVESNCESVKKLSPNTYGFVVDTKPDDVPVRVIDYLYIGSQDCAVESVLTKYEIRHVLSLGIDVSVTVNHKYVECLDLPETDIKTSLQEALPFLCKAVESKENVLVHCNAGVSRTSMVTIAYLMQYKMMQFEEAYSLIKSCRPAIRPNDGFQKQLKVLKLGQLI